MFANYPECYKAVRQFEGGNDDDPRDPGGRTSRGIIQREWNAFRKTHPGRPADVWRAPESDIAEIYRTKYWDALYCSALPSGVDESVFDYGVNSGIGRSAKVLRRCLHLPDSASFGQVKTRLASLSIDQTKVLIRAINDERLAFLRRLRTWSVFGRGWGTRVSRVLAISLYLADHPVGGVPVQPRDVEKANAKAMNNDFPVIKNVTTSSGSAVAIVATISAFWKSYPILTGVLVVAILAIACAIFLSISTKSIDAHDASPPGWTPPPELKPDAGASAIPAQTVKPNP